MRMSISTTSGRGRAHDVDRLAPVGRLAHDLEVGLRVDEHADAGAEQRLVVDEHDADRRAHVPGLRSGSSPHDELAAVARRPSSRAARELRPLAHADDPWPVARDSGRARIPGRPHRGCATAASVDAARRARASHRGDGHASRIRARVPPVAVAQGVRERLLQDAVDRELHGRRRRRRAAPDRRRPAARRPPPAPARRAPRGRRASAADRRPGCAAAASSSSRTSASADARGAEIVPSASVAAQRDRLPRRTARRRPARSRPRASARRRRACRARCARAPARRPPRPRRAPAPRGSRARAAPCARARRSSTTSSSAKSAATSTASAVGDRRPGSARRRRIGPDEEVERDDDRADDRRREARPRTPARDAVGGGHVEHGEDREVDDARRRGRSPSARSRPPTPAPSASPGDSRRTPSAAGHEQRDEHGRRAH